MGYQVGTVSKKVPLRATSSATPATMHRPAQGVPVEVHTFAGHPHGYAGWKIIDGKGNPNFDLWVTHADAFLMDVFYTL